MPSFELSYDADEDALEVTFALFEETFARTLPLNDHVILYTDLGLGAAWGIALYSYSTLVDVNETELSGLKELTEPQIEACLELLSRPPASLFLEVTDGPALIARVRSPSLTELMAVE